jgi:hypothetical protein
VKLGMALRWAVINRDIAESKKDFFKRTGTR